MSLPMPTVKHTGSNRNAKKVSILGGNGLLELGCGLSLRVLQCECERSVMRDVIGNK